MKFSIRIPTRIPRSIILLVDAILVFFSFSLAYFIAFDFRFTYIIRGNFFIYTGLFTLIAVPVYGLFRIHMGLIRYSSLQDVVRIFLASLFATALYPVMLDLIRTQIYNSLSAHLTKVLLINFFVSSTSLILLRLGVKGFYNYIQEHYSTANENILIYGTDNDSVLIKNAIESNPYKKTYVRGFIGTKNEKSKIYIQQRPVYRLGDLKRIKSKFNIATLIVTQGSFNRDVGQEVIEQCLELGIKILKLPATDQWISGKLNLKQLQDLKIEDLLQRDPIIIDNESISNDLSGKRVLITGAAGSIGSETVRQISAFKPELLILCDQAESPLFEIVMEIEERKQGVSVKPFLSDITNAKRMARLFKEFRPQVVFHAAAYKHVPMMESHSEEAIVTNVLGTRILADLAVLFDAEKFVMISTDKAVNPTNVMGASKRIAEIYIQSLNFVPYHQPSPTLKSHLENPSPSVPNNTRFITTRFGNVLGSNGSVVPIFKRQIQSGGPVKITHPEIRRFFMTIPEAVELILEAETMGNGGEIFVFDMGDPVKIKDLALNMIRLAGLTPGKDIDITYTGLRPGEKLFEEVLNDEETTLATHHTKIRIAKVRKENFTKISSAIDNLLSLLRRTDDKYSIINKMQEIVPEFRSARVAAEH
jgi:FlaA1/EpsC-like NDP-sugar epimerase